VRLLCGDLGCSHANAGTVTQPIGGDYVSEQLLMQLKQEHNLNVVAPFKILRRRPVDVGCPAEVVLKRLQHITKSFEHRAIIVRPLLAFI
jgi:hypothetical protein